MAETGRARLPIVDSLKDGVTGHLVAADQRVRRSDTSEGRMSRQGYLGAAPLTQKFHSKTI